MAAADGTLRIEVAYSPAAGVVEQVELQLAPGSTLAQALRASGLLERHGLGEVDALALGIWGKRCTPDALLSDRDRVEVYRPLTIDPKEARRLRHRKHIERRAKP
jgi:uncharacterized protein